MNLLNNIKDIFEQLLGYMVVATSSSLIKVFYIKEEGSVWSKIGKFVSAILFGLLIIFIYNQYEKKLALGIIKESNNMEYP